MASTSMSVRSPPSFPFPTAAGARGRVGLAQPVGPKLLSSPLLPAATPAGDVAGSVVEFDRAIELDQRQKQYSKKVLDVAANPNDTEESIWCFPCEAQLYGVGLDSRSVMREAYALFKDGGDPEKLASNFSSGSEGESFYSSLYTGLYYESQKDAELAKSHIVAACRSPYGSRSGDYMASLALVHCQCRNWTLE
uniref:Uncharacterized protein n=1 Tax=Oryza nivara TaxID=4536 RepID=A0A0E0FLA8_ORYNI